MDDTDIPPTTTDAAIPAPTDDRSLSVGRNGVGPLLLHDHYLVEKIARFNRERVPERVVHAKGGGAHGFFEVTTDAEQWTRAAFLSGVGRRTPVFVRFSTVAGELGSADTARDPRGFAVKFYTDEGNYDIVGNNTPVFFIRDPAKFSDFIHSQKRMPETNLRSHEAQWDFWTLSPESAHQVTILMSDRGTPRSWRHMHGYGSHTFMWINAAGARSWVKYHFKTEQGIENLTSAEAKTLAADDADHHVRDLFNAIRGGDHPTWRVEVQIMPFEDAGNYRFNPFDVTKVWPHSDYPPIPIGRLVLDRNPTNHFAEVEQAAFEPANLVPGIGPSPDKMLLGRIFSYPDAHRHRIGTNYLQLPINRPIAPVHSYNKDGAMRFTHPGAQPTYSPNSAHGPRADRERNPDASWFTSGDIGRYDYARHGADTDFVQARTLWDVVLSRSERDSLVENAAEHLSQDVRDATRARAVAFWRSVAPDLGDRIAATLNQRQQKKTTTSPAIPVTGQGAQKQ